MHSDTAHHTYLKKQSLLITVGLHIQISLTLCSKLFHPEKWRTAI